MYQNYKVVVNTAAGRRRYMQYLVPPILNADIVDRYDIWVNTRNMVDIEFFKKLAQKYPKVNLVWQPDGVVNGIASIPAPMVVPAMIKALPNVLFFSIKLFSEYKIEKRG